MARGEVKPPGPIGFSHHEGTTPHDLVDRSLVE
jgi:hypothetical protein